MGNVEDMFGTIEPNSLLKLHLSVNLINLRFPVLETRGEKISKIDIISW